MIKITDTVKHLIIINVLFFIATYAVKQYDLYDLFALHSYRSPNFRSWQVITHAFMHGDINHLLFNMFSLVMIGSSLEEMWGSKRFLNFYLMTAYGSAIVFLLFRELHVMYLLREIPFDQIKPILNNGLDLARNGKQYADSNLSSASFLVNFSKTVGASGAIVGLFAAFAALFPNREMSLIFVPIPIKAKYMMMGMILISISMGFANFSWDNISHLGHLSGIIIGLFLIKKWGGYDFNRWN